MSTVGYGDVTTKFVLFIQFFSLSSLAFLFLISIKDCLWPFIYYLVNNWWLGTVYCLYICLYNDKYLFYLLVFSFLI